MNLKPKTRVIPRSSFQLHAFLMTSDSPDENNSHYSNTETVTMAQLQRKLCWTVISFQQLVVWIIIRKWENGQTGPSCPFCFSDLANIILPVP